MTRPRRRSSSPASALAPRHRHVGRRSRGPERAPGAVRAAVRTRNYVPNVFIQYWSMRVMAYLATLVVLLALWGAWLRAPKKLEHAQVVPRRRAVGVDRAVPDEHRRLDADRERAPALDRAGAHEDHGRGVAVGEHRPMIWITLIVFTRALHRARAIADVVLMLRFGRRRARRDEPAAVPRGRRRRHAGTRVLRS